MSKFLSLNWFKSKIETAVEKVIASKIEDLMKQEDPDHTVNDKPYIKIKFVNDVLTIVLNSGDVISKPDATTKDYVKALTALTEEELFDIVSSQEVRIEKIAREKEVAKIQALQKGLSTLAQLKDFEVRGNSVYLSGINRSLPQLLVEKFVEVIERVKYYAGFGDLEEALAEDEEYQGLKRFFMWCCLNPRAEVADSLYEFLMKNSFRITKQGFFAALRNVVTLHGSPELVHFVSNAYNKVKAIWKKNPNNYHVILQEDDTYKLIEKEQMYKTTSETCEHCEGSGRVWDEDENCYIECPYCDECGYVDTVVRNFEGEDLGVLTDLYLDLPNREENRFTDDWTKTFDIRIGKVVNMPSEQCNWSTQDCAAAGLHFTSDQIHYVGCGDQSVLVLINPMKVVGIGEHKGRCYEYLPIMTVPREEATEILHDLDFDVLALDEDFAIRELENLQEIATQGFAVESKKYDFNIPSISAKEIKNIVVSLDEMKNEISKRVIKID
jgi:hypothetical protein